MKKRIMVVDDDPMICQMCKRLLTDAGYEVVTELSGSRCMMYLRNPEKPFVHLIILDVEMPSMNGFKTLATIRQSSTLANTPVMFLTSSCSSKTVAQAIALGVNDYLKKPFNSEELVRRVDRLLSYDADVKGEEKAPENSGNTDEAAAAEIAPESAETAGAEEAAPAENASESTENAPAENEKTEDTAEAPADAEQSAGENSAAGSSAPESDAAGDEASEETSEEAKEDNNVS